MKNKILPIIAIIIVIVAICVIAFIPNNKEENIKTSKSSNTITTNTTSNQTTQAKTMEATLNDNGDVEIKLNDLDKWIINAPAEKLNGCNNEIIIPKYNIDIKLVEGENVVEFTPDEEGDITYTCWMGMIKSTITVIE